uniref:Aminopeptidase n=1 Tax=Ostrinia furnacalis TaxID=93504 RepID=B5A8Y0_OSTFU|nr:Cry1Ab-RR resistance protein APN2 [Ostrinia furnacalis]
MLLLLVALIGSAVASPVSQEESRTLTNEQLAAQYNLPRETIPTFYDVTLFLNPSYPDNFNGSVSIRIVPNITTNVIVLHAMEMEILNIEVFNVLNTTADIFQIHFLATDDTHFLRIFTTEQMLPNQLYIVNIEYRGQYASNMFGIYVSTYEQAGLGTVNLVTSQLQPTFARRAFPCYDEPALKAIFRTTIYAPPGYPTVRSNMPLRNDTNKPEIAGWVKHEFQDTLDMSTYLLAYLVSSFEYISNEDDPIYEVPFRVYSRPGTQNNSEFALDFGQKNMIALENYIELPYAFPKLDKAAVPDFAAGAMENWGLVIYREVALLVTEGVTTTQTLQNIGRIICHENMHMWFGNEVGPYSWTYTWLNEGFANFFENFATDLVNPHWRMMDQYVIAVQNVFQSDAVLSVNPMTYPVFTPSQIISTFNAVAYQKSGSVIRMMQHYLTPEIFRQGLVQYVSNMSRRAAQPSDLFANLQEVLDASNHSIPWPIATIMDRWTNQGGFPVLTVFRSAPTANSLTIAQERFLTDRSLTSTDRWHVPVNWVLSTDPNFNDTSPQGWIPPSFPAVAIDIPGLNQAEWYIVNKQQTGYYRVNYDVQNWAALASVLNSTHELIHVLNRAQIIDDAFNLARNGRVNYNYALEISRYLVREEDYIPWAAANAAFAYLDVVLTGSEVYHLFQRYVLELTAPLYSSLGFNNTANDEFVTAYHRTIVLNFNCRFGNEHCVETAQEMLESFRTTQVRLAADIQTTVYCSGLRGGDADNFDFLWDEYLKSTDSSEQSILLNALGCTSNADRRQFYMNQVINETSQVREQDRHTILVSTINASPENMEEALDFVVENFHLIQPRVQGLSGTTNILNALSRRLTTQAHSDKVDQLFNRHQFIFTAGELASIGAIRENIAASLTWSAEYLDTVESWLVENYTDSASIITSSFVIFISIFISIFNH